MISLTVFFWFQVLLFAIIGAMRGWAKEILVTFSVILSLFLITVLETYVGVVRSIIQANPTGEPVFWLRTTLIILLVFFGYQTPTIRGLAGARFARERLQDVLLGFILGALNGYLVVGSLWYFMNAAGYPFRVVQPPQPTDPYFDTAVRLINMLPPQWLTVPWIFLAVGVAFLFVIVVFI